MLSVLSRHASRKRNASNRSGRATLISAQVLTTLFLVVVLGFAAYGLSDDCRGYCWSLAHREPRRKARAGDLELADLGRGRASSRFAGANPMRHMRAVRERKEGAEVV